MADIRRRAAAGIRRDGRRRGRASAPRRFAPGVVPLEGRALLSTLLVKNLDDGGPDSLRAQVQAAASGDTVAFDPGLSGTIALTSGPILTNYGADLTIEGPGASTITVSGGGKSQVFFAGGPTPGGNTVAISGLTIADGNANGAQGGAVANFGANLTIADSVLRDNQAGSGGAIFNAGRSPMTLDRDTFVANTAGAAGSPRFGLGGAIFNLGTLTIADSTFRDNRALGSLGQGGAIQDGFSSALTVSGSTFTGNLASGTQVGAGGAIFDDTGTVLQVVTSQFVENRAEGTGAFASATGGAIVDSPSTSGRPNPSTISASSFMNNVAAGTGDSAGAQGGALATDGGTLDLTDSQFVGNAALGGVSATGMGGPAAGGAIFAAGDVLAVAGTVFLADRAVGGDGATGGGFAAGGGINLLFGTRGATSTIVNSQFSGDSAVSGAGGGANDFAQGGGLAIVASGVAVTDTSFDGDSAVGGLGRPGAAGGAASGGAIRVDSGSSLALQGGQIIGSRAAGGDGGPAVMGAGGDGGDASGGGIDARGILAVTDTTIALNQAAGGRGGDPGGNGGNAGGGGVTVGGASATFDRVTILFNLASGGQAAAGGTDGQGLGGGLDVVAGTADLTSTLVLFNTATTADDDIHGPVNFH